MAALTEAWMVALMVGPTAALTGVQMMVALTGARTAGPTAARAGRADRRG